VGLFDLLLNSGVETGTTDGTLASGYEAVISDGSTEETFTYQDFNSTRNFYPNTGPDTENTTGAYEVPPVIALDESGPIDVTTTAADALNTADFDAETDVNQYLFGFKEEQYLDQMTAERFVAPVTSITIIEPNPEESISIYTDEGSGEQLVDTYTHDELEAMAITNDDLGFLLYKGGWTVYATDKYVTLDTLLLASLGIDVSGVTSVTVEASDGFGKTFTATDLANGQNFYPDVTPSTNPTTNADPVGSVIALEWGSAAVTTTGAAAFTTIINANNWAQTSRFFIGLDETDYGNDNAPGNRFVTSPTKIVVS
jgi:hypothetical protein